MKRHVEKVVILGSGVMGSAIAAHFANAGVPSLVLDIVPTELTAAEEARGKSLRDNAIRNRIAVQAVAALRKTKPSPLFSSERMALIETGNLEDDLPRLKEADWVIEVVVENMAIKKKVFAAVVPHLAPDAVFSSNTSGLSLQEMAEALPEELRPRFLGTHFFNPPRYMKLFELIPTPYTDPGVLDAVATYARNHLGKGIVVAKDTPNFIANRIGTHAMMASVGVMQEMGLSIEELDALTGPAIGRPKTATFKLADLVGLDTFLHVTNNIYPLIPDDESREVFKAPEYLQRMVKKGLLGRKSGGGFYKLEKTPAGEKKFYTLDLETLSYRDKQKAKFPALEAAKAVDDTQERLRQLIWGKGRATEAIWKILASSFSYSAMRLGEICDDCASIDHAVCWGFNWELGPFETWDCLGFRKVTDRLKADNYPLPQWVDALYDSGAETLYTEVDGVLHSPTATASVSVPVPRDERSFAFEILHRTGKEVKSNPGASLLDLGDGVLGLEFRSKMNAIGQDTINMIMTACSEAEANWEALVVANGADNFSVGANLMLLMMEAQEGNWDEIDLIVRAFQGANDRLEKCGVPVVTAPHGLALGGGCEITMAGNAVRAAAETYIGLVEFGAGVIPAGGGSLRLYQRNVANLPDPKDTFPALKKTFETIGMAKVATSAEEARELGFLRPGDSWSMNRDHLVADAKELALAMARVGYQAPLPDPAIPVMGKTGLALVESVLFNMNEAQYISEHDRKIGRELGRILSGGDIPGPTTVSELHMLDLERERVLRLISERKTLERLAH